jgi:hypothetical protein
LYSPPTLGKPWHVYSSSAAPIFRHTAVASAAVSAAALGVAVQVAFEKQTEKTGFSLHGLKG